MARFKLSPRNWALVKTSTLKARRFPGNSNKFQPINPVAFRLNTPVCVALIENRTANYSWWLAGWCQAYFYSGAFVNRQLTSIQEWKIGLSRPVLLDFRKYPAQTYALEFTFAKWHRDIKLQVWKYTGDLTDAVDVDLQKVIADLARLEKKVDDISEYGR